MLHLFLLTPPAQAQTAAISGHVFDAADRRSLPGAHLHLLQAADSSLLVSAMADMDGNFALKLPDTTAPLLLKATYLGYADRYTAIEGDTPLEIEMQARDYAIGGVVVKAPLFQRTSARTSPYVSYEVVSAPNPSVDTDGRRRVTLSLRSPAIILRTVSGTASRVPISSREPATCSRTTRSPAGCTSAPRA